MITTDTMLYRCQLTLILLANVLASAMLISMIVHGGVNHWSMPCGVVCNLLGYLALTKEIR